MTPPFILLLLAICVSSSWHTDAIDVLSPEKLPPPWQDTSNFCHPRGYSNAAQFTSICDPSGLLSIHELSNLDSILRHIYTGTRPYSLVKCTERPPSDTAHPATHGFHVAMALVRRMQFDQNTLSQRAQHFADVLFSNWHLSDNCGASVLLFLSIEDRQMYIKTGATAVRYLNEHQIDDVYKRMIPKLQRDRLNAALHAGVQTIAHFLAKYQGEHAGPRATDDGAGTASPPPLFFRGWPAWWDLHLSIVAIIVAVFVVIACCNGVGGIEAARKRREKKQLLRKLDTVRDEYFGSMMESYAPSTCPICHEKVALSWEPIEPALSSEGDALADGAATHRRRSVRTLRCGHTFHDRCFDDEYPTPSGTIPSCPVCGDVGSGASTPPSLRETRMQDVSFRLNRLHDQYPHILSDEVMAKLEAEPPNIWPNPMKESYLKNVQRPPAVDDENSHTGNGSIWGGVGGALAAGGIGALVGSALSGFGRRGNDSYYGSIGGASDGGGGHGTGWVSNVTNAFSGGGHGAGWGGGGGGGGGGGDGGGHGTGW